MITSGEKNEDENPFLHALMKARKSILRWKNSVNGFEMKTEITYSHRRRSYQALPLN